MLWDGGDHPELREPEGCRGVWLPVFLIRAIAESVTRGSTRTELLLDLVLLLTFPTGSFH